MHSAKPDPSTDFNRVVLLMKASGAEGSEMDRGNRHGSTVLFMMASGRTTEHMAKESSLILTEMFMKATGSMIKLMGTVSIHM